MKLVLWSFSFHFDSAVLCYLEETLRVDCGKSH